MTSEMKVKNIKGCAGVDSIRSIQVTLASPKTGDELELETIGPVGKNLTDEEIKFECTDLKLDDEEFIKEIKIEPATNTVWSVEVFTTKGQTQVWGNTERPFIEITW